MATDKRAFTMRMQPKNFEKIKFISEHNKRSIAMQIEYLIEKCILEYEKENGEILNIPNNQNIKENKMDDTIEKEIEAYRLELEAERKVKTSSVSEDTKRKKA